MGICGSAEENKAVTNEIPKQSVKRNLCLYGDLLDADTRTLIVAFSLGGIKHQFVEVNTLLGDH